MTSNAVIDVAIGLILLYLLLSLVCTTLNELISTVLSLRSGTLKTGIAQMLDDPQIKSAFYDHGLIASTVAASGDKHPSYLSGRTFALALLSSVNPTSPIPEFNDVLEAISSLPDSNVRDLLLSQLVNAQGDLQKVRDGVAVCFDQAMDRVSGVYKRKLKWVSLLVAALITLACDADSVIVVNTLWSDGTLRAQLVQSAQGVVKAGLPSGTDSDANLRKVKDIESSVPPLPLGWHMPSKNSDPISDKIWHFLSRLLGLTLTAFAVSLGAPFWFDLLGKFVNLRGTGPAPERTDPDGS